MINKMTMANNMLAFQAKVLIVEDDEDLRHVESDLFKMYAKNHNDNDFETVLAPTYDAARKALDSGTKFDLVTTDGHLGSDHDKPLNSGDGDGLKIIKAAKEKGFPVVMISGDSTLEEPALNEGANFYDKPKVAQAIKAIAANLLYAKKD